MAVTQINGVTINKLSLEKYRELKNNSSLETNESYVITDIDEQVPVYKKSLDTSNPIILRNLDTGIYKIYGYFKFYSSYSGISAADPFAYAIVEKGTSYSYVTVLSSNSANRYKITDTNYEDLNPAPSIMTIRVNETFTETSGGAYNTIPMILHNSNGNRLSYTNNSIVIGSNVNKILVNGSMILTANTTGNKHLRIYKNNTPIGWVLSRATVTGQEFSLSISPILIDVVEGDVITLKSYISTNDKITGGTYIPTYLTVQEIKK